MDDNEGQNFKRSQPHDQRTEEPTHHEHFKYWTPAANRVLLTLHTDELAKIDRIIETGDVTIPKVIQQQ